MSTTSVVNLILDLSDGAHEFLVLGGDRGLFSPSTLGTALFAEMIEYTILKTFYDITTIGRIN